MKQAKPWEFLPHTMFRRISSRSKTNIRKLISGEVEDAAFLNLQLEIFADWHAGSIFRTLGALDR